MKAFLSVIKRICDVHNLVYLNAIKEIRVMSANTALV